MSPERFEGLLGLVAPYITKKFCRSRMPISASERLCLCLRYLASGDSQQTQSLTFRIGRSTVSNIIRETCEGIWQALKDKYMKAPETIEEWLSIATEFENEWHFPNCISAIDGKHICIECPKNAGSSYFNYKHFHSMVLLAVCDAKYCFTLVNIGSFGRDNDAAILSESGFGKLFESDTMTIPQPREISGHKLPYVLVGDEIFPLKPWLMKPYPGRGMDEPKRIYNYRLSRARRTIENSFGIMAARWRIFRRPIRANVQTVEQIVKAVVCLHNYSRLTDNATYIPGGFVDCESNDGRIIPGDWRNVVHNDDSGLVNLGQIGGNRYRYDASACRDTLKDYFNSPEGSVKWQYQHVRNCGVINE